MNGLVLISKTMSSLEIAGLTGKRHDNVKADIEKMFDELELDILNSKEVKKNHQNQDIIVFRLNEELSLTLVSGYKLKMRHAIIKRWQELESKATAFEIPQTLPEALRLAADLQEDNEKKQKQIEFKDELIVASNEASIKAGEILVSEFCKSIDIVDIGSTRFYEWMRSQGFIFKHSREPMQQYIDRGIFTWKPTEDRHGGKFRYTLRITPRGKVWLAVKYLAYIDIED